LGAKLGASTIGYNSYSSQMLLCSIRVIINMCAPISPRSTPRQPHSSFAVSGTREGDFPLPPIRLPSRKASRSICFGDRFGPGRAWLFVWPHQVAPSAFRDPLAMGVPLAAGERGASGGHDVGQAAWLKLAGYCTRLNARLPSKVPGQRLGSAAARYIAAAPEKVMLMKSWNTRVAGPCCSARFQARPTSMVGMSPITLRVSMR
jgi:hypothetical protein